MARKQVYGKRSQNLFTSFAAFQSPTKVPFEPPVIEVDDITRQLEALNAPFEEVDELPPPRRMERKVLYQKDSNAALKPVRRGPLEEKTKTRCEQGTELDGFEQPNRCGGTEDLKSHDVLEEDTPCITTTPYHRAGRSGLVDIVEDAENLPPPKEATQATTPSSNILDAKTDALTRSIHTLKIEQQLSTLSASPKVSRGQRVSHRRSLSDSLPLPRDILLEATPPSHSTPGYADPLLALASSPINSYEAWSTALSTHFAISKIAEASFGEVYRLSLLQSHPSLTASDESVLKIIALKPSPNALIALKGKARQAAQKKANMMSAVEDVAGEVRLMQRMSSIPGFTNFRALHLLQGRPGAAFVEAWKAFNVSQKEKGKEKSLFPDPGKKTSYNDEQLWAVIEMQDAGTDLENVRLENIWACWDVWWGVVLALGKGEEGARFEHRDLHLGNICVRQSSDRGPFGEVQEGVVDARKKFGYTGIETTIIDYTISRAEMDLPAHSNEDDVAYFDLDKDSTLFEGNSQDEYQYDIYRYMRSAMYLDEPLANFEARRVEAKQSGRTWRGYHPQTNLVWLHFLLHKLVEQLEWPGSIRSSGEVRDQNSVRAAELETALLRIQCLLDPETFSSSGMTCAGDLVNLALEEGWLDEVDVMGAQPTTKRIISGKKYKNSTRRRRL
ncbi:hypothetical protein LTR50_003330 [Elasticomyces elasticus]|nr:hypothetical protein LTR50_003330 [Elasticomyces elasticus]